MRNFYAMRSFSVGVVIFFSSIFYLKAEGTKELRPANTDINNFRVSLWSSTNQATRKTGTFASHAEAQYRINIRVCNVGEVINMGFQIDNDVFFRLRKPDGSTVNFNSAAPASGLGSPVLADQDPGALFAYRCPNTGAGRIADYNQAFAGPAPAAGGYTPLQVIADQVGDYYIEFNPGNATTTNIAQRRFNFFDITVWNNNTARTPLPGRLWTLVWDIAGDADFREFIAEVFIYSTDQIVTAVNFNRMRPINFVITANSTGCTATGNPGIDRKSRVGNINYPEYKLFLNNPDPACFPDRPFGCLAGAVTVEGCSPANRCFRIPVTQPGHVEVLLDFDRLAPFGVGFDQDSRDRIITADVVAGTNCIPWDSRDGLGNLVSPGQLIEMEINYFNGNTHIPMFDAENHPNGYSVRLVRPGTNTCSGGSNDIRVFWDDEAPTTTADPTYTGGPINITATYALDGGVNLGGAISTPGNGRHRWALRGENQCFPNCPETMNTWWYANILTTNTSYTVPNIVVDANRNNPVGERNDTTICNNLVMLQLRGSVSGSVTAGTWSTNGDGLFSDNRNMDGTYTFGPTDKTNPNLEIYLLADPVDTCTSVRDTLFIDFVPGPTVSAGLPQDVCKNDPIFTLAGSVGGSTATFQWSASVPGGIFVPNAQTLNATYQAPVAVTGAPGTTVVTLTLTSLTNTGTVACPASNSSVNVSYFAAPITDAGSGYSFCSNTPTINLTGTINGGSSTTGFTVSWTGNGGIVNGTTLNPTYTPTAAERAAGVARVVLHVSNTVAPLCDEVTDTATIMLSAPPAVTAGVDFQFCSNRIDDIPLVGTVTGTGATSLWTCSNCSGGSFGGTETNDTATYSPSAVDLTQNSLQFTLTATSPGCPPQNDVVVVTINDPVTVSDLGILSVCETNPCLTLTASPSSPAPGRWVTVHAGANPIVSPTNLTITYCLSAAEIASLLTAVDYIVDSDGNCLADSARVFINVIPSPKPTAGPDHSVCANNATVSITGASGTGTVTWNSLSASPGTFNFSAPFSSVNPQYSLSATEISNGSATLVMSMISNGCAAEFDTLEILVTPIPTVNAGPDLSVCVNNPTVALVGAVSVGTPAPQWSVFSGTTGTFSSSNTVNTNFTATSPVAGGTTTVRLTLTGAGCNPVFNDAIITYTAIPVVTVTTASAVTVCKSNPNVAISATFDAPATGLIWTSSSGTGSFLPSATSPNATYVPAQSDLDAGNVTLRATSNGQGNCNAVIGDNDVFVTFTEPPIANAGSDVVLCENNVTAVNISGSFTPATVTGQTWTSSSGCATCFGDNTALSTTYLPSAGDIAAGSVTLTLSSTGGPFGCLPVDDELIITFNGAPTVSAGPDLTICTTQNTVVLNGSSTASSSVTWSIVNGSGSFTSTSTAVTTYNISATDKTNGTVEVRLTANGLAGCASVSDVAFITFTDIPTVDVGPDHAACNNLPIQLEAIGSPGSWSASVGGTFNPSANVQTTTFTPTGAPASITFTFTSPASGGCPAVSDNFIATLSPAPTVVVTVSDFCSATMSTINVNAALTNATTGFWTSNGSGTFGDANATSTTFNPTASDIAGSSLTFTFQTTGTAPCPAITSSDVAVLTDLILTAGPPQNMCGEPGTAISLTASAIVNGIPNNAVIGSWTDNGVNTVTFPAVPNAHTASYTVGAGEAATLQFTVNSLPVLACPAVSDVVDITLIAPPTVIIDPVLDICQTDVSVSLTGTINGVPSQSGTWNIVGGTGTFAPSDAWTTVQNTTSYVLSTADRSLTSLTVTLTTDNTLCGTRTASRTFDLDTRPDVIVGPDDTICANAATYGLNAIITPVGTAGTWSSSSSCNTCFAASTTFGPTATFYNASATDIGNGFVTLTLTSAINGACPADSDKVVVRITPGPDVDAGPDRTVCANNSTINIVGTVNTPFTLEWRALNGGGTFGAGNTATSTAPSTTFTPSASAISTGFAEIVLRSVDPDGRCADDDDTIRVTITPAPILALTVPTNVCGNEPFFQLDAADISTPGTANPVGIWSVSPAGGTFVNDNAASDTAIYIPTADQRVNGGTVTLTFTTPNALCSSVSLSAPMTILPSPRIDILEGDSTEICANATSIELNTDIFNHANGVQWTTSGTGTFDGTANNFSNLEDIEYFYSNVDRAAGVVTLSVITTGGNPCLTARAQYKIKIQPMPIADAGADVTICQTESSVSLVDASVLNATGGEWFTTGTGVFDPTNLVVGGVYHPSQCCVSPLDSAQNEITLTLRTTGNGLCPADEDTRKITFLELPFINPIDTFRICEDSLNVQLNSVSGRTDGITWSAPDGGTFAPSVNVANPFYAPTGVGTFRVVLTAVGVGNCASVSEVGHVIVRPAPTLNIGPDGNICEIDNEGFGIAGVVSSGVTSLQWSSNTDPTGNLFSPDPSFNPTYAVNAADRINGFVNITAVTLGGIGTCKPVSDQLTIIIDRAPTLTLGPDIEICTSLGGNPIGVSASYTNASSGSWFTPGTGVFAVPTDDNTTLLIANPLEREANDTAFAIYTTGGSGACNAITDTVLILFEDNPAFTAGADIRKCFTATSTNSVQLNSGGVVGTWSVVSGGTGNFTPLATTPNATFTPTSAIADNTTFVLSFDPSDVCYVGTDNVNVIYLLTPELTTPPVSNICETTTSVPIAATSNAGGLTWSVSQGFGTIANAALPSTSYNVHANDDNLTNVRLFVTSNHNIAFCPQDVDTITFRVVPSPKVNAGPNQNLCSDRINTAAVTLTGTVTNGSLPSWTSPHGTFSAPGSLTTTFTPSVLPATITLTAQGIVPCTAVNRSLTINPVNAPVVVLLPDKDTCALPSALNLIDIVNAGSSSGFTSSVWSVVSGNGNITPNNSTLAAQYHPTAVDFGNGFVELRLTATNTGICTSIYSDVFRFNLEPQPQVSGGADQKICATLEDVPILGGTLTRPTNIVWETLGSGNFASATTLTPNTYTLSTQDSINGGAVLRIRTDNVAAGIPCPNDTDFVAIVVSPAPLAVVNAGLDKFICIDRPSAVLNGFVLNASGGLWQVVNNQGNSSNLSSPTNLSASYQFDAADRARGFVVLSLTSVGQDVVCDPVVDTVVLNFTPVPVITPSADDQVCASNPVIQLGTSITQASIGQGMWSGGDGVFSPNEFTINAQYFPGPGDIAAGKVYFTLTSSNNGTCVGHYSERDSSLITPFTIANTTSNNIICANAAGVLLTATSSTAGGTWSMVADDGSVTPTSNVSTIFNANFIPGPTDIINQSASVKFVTTGGTCEQDSILIVIPINPAPTVVAAPDILVCADLVNGPGIPISAEVTVAGSGIWSQSANAKGIITSVNNTPTATGRIISAVYFPAASDTVSTNGPLILTLTSGSNLSSGGAMCVAENDQLQISFIPTPFVDANSANTCTTMDGVQLNGVVSTHPVHYPFASGEWTTTGSGTFSPDRFTKNAQYFPSGNDLRNGQVNLTWTSVGAGSCNPIQVTVPMFIKTPVTDAGPDQLTCNLRFATFVAVPDDSTGAFDRFYEWFEEDGTFLDSAVSITVNTPGNYVLQMTDRFGCKALDTTSLDMYVIPANNMLSEVCHDPFLYVHLMTLPDLDARGSIQWTFNDQVIAGANLDSVRAHNPGIYSAIYTIDACELTYDSTNVHDVPHFMVPNVTTCNDSLAILTATPLGASGVLNFEWFGDVPSGPINPADTVTGTGVTTGSPASLMASTTPFDTLTYLVVATDVNSCKSLLDVEVIGVPVPRPFIPDSMACANDAISLDAYKAPSNLGSLYPYGVDLSWFRQDDRLTVLSRDSIFTTAQTDRYVLVVGVGQCINEDTTDLRFQPYPEKILPSDFTLCMDQAKLKVIDAGPGVVGGDVLDVTYLWTGPGANAADTNQTFTVLLEDFTNIDSEDNTYNVRMTSFYDGGDPELLECPVDEEITIHDVCAPRVFTSTAFHPGDPNSMDAFFTVQGKYFTNFKLLIFNRWGEIIFQSTDKNDSWDGTYRGDPMPIGVYAYTIYYEGKSDEYKGGFKKDGRVVLIR